VAPAPTLEAAQLFLDELRRRHPDATHHCFAWRVGWPPAERAADAGEPSGTAGQPILRALAGAGLSDVVAVVVRWFGGTKLGKGGLARAYAGATVAALAALPTRPEFPARTVEIRLPYERVGAVKRLLRPPEIALVEERYGAEATLLLRVGESALAELRAALGELRLAAIDCEPHTGRRDGSVA
jgi:uncharacterized YigZ family protein